MFLHVARRAVLFSRRPDFTVGVAANSLLKKSVLENLGATAGLSSSVFRGFLAGTAGQASSGTLFQRAAKPPPQQVARAAKIAVEKWTSPQPSRKRSPFAIHRSIIWEHAA